VQSEPGFVENGSKLQLWESGKLGYKPRCRSAARNRPGAGAV